MNASSRPAKLLVAGVALSAALTLSACGSDDSDAASSSASSSSSSSAEFARPEPVASLPAIPAGGSTAVALDQGFVDALGPLGLTPGIVGDATLADGGSLPDHRRHRDYYDQADRLPSLRPGRI